MTQRIAEEDITEVNDSGQTVVLVHKGQPIPEGFDADAAKSTKKAKKGD